MYNKSSCSQLSKMAADNNLRGIVMSRFIFSAPTGDGWMNLARDGFFLDNVKKGDVILYFYVNTNAVIIGRNQNAWKECSLANMERDGVQLVRRHTGGGAVYHDTGNLNFSFIMNEKDYNLERQMKVIMKAVGRLGVECELSGRNDILANGRKFSGNAYGLSKGNRAHHGTLLVNTDMSRLQNYLNVSKEKMQAKGVDSVRSRVCNLSDFVPNITVEKMRRYVIESFIEEYGPSTEYRFEGEELAEVEKRREVHASWEWRLGKTPQFEVALNHRFSFGETQLHMNFTDGFIREIKVYSDSLDTELAGEVEKALVGARLEDGAIRNALKAMDSADAAGEIADFICSSDLLR